MPIAIYAEQRALQASTRDWAARCLSIAGGTSQILLSMVAERALGLPRDEAR